MWGYIRNLHRSAWYAGALSTTVGVTQTAEYPLRVVFLRGDGVCMFCIIASDGIGTPFLLPLWGRDEVC